MRSRLRPRWTRCSPLTRATSSFSRPAWAKTARRGERLFFCDHLEHDGEGLFNLVCESDLEGIVAKRKFDPYLEHHASWLKIRNQRYSQWIEREELFERERGGSPDVQLWQTCALACENTEM